MGVLIGVMSDSHDNITMIQAALAILQKHNVLMILHAGDIVSPFMARALRGLDRPLHLVFGNNDGDQQGLVKFFEGLGTFHGRAAQFTVEGRRIGMTHGDNEVIRRAFIKSKMFDLVVTGHTHLKEINMVEDVLVVNPGETCGYLTGSPSVAIVDLDALTAKTIDLRPPSSPLPA